MAGINYIENQEKFGQLVRGFQWIIFACLALATLAILSIQPVDWTRMQGVALFFLIAILSRWSLRFGTGIGIQVHVIGLWLVNCYLIWSKAGVHSANMVLFPILLGVTGWALGRRWLLISATCTGLFVLALVGAEVAGFYKPTDRAHPFLVGTVTLTVLVGSAYLMQLLFSDFARSRLQLTQLTEQLKQSNADLLDQNAALLLREQEVQNLNQTLESRVEQRTSELKVAMQQLEKSQTSLARSERLAALGALVAGVSHELNTPIGNSVTAASTLLHELEVIGKLVETNQLKRSQLISSMGTLQTGLELLARNLDRAAQLVRSFKQVSVDQTSEVRRPFVLAKVVSDVVNSVLPSYKSNPHRIEFEAGPDVVLDSYPGAVTQVVINLVQNAFVHAFDDMQSGGLVSISIRQKTHDDGSEHACIVVRDNGCGISPANLKRVYEPFFTTKMGRGGTGLGLNIVYNIVTDILGGAIRLQSVLGEGTSVHIEIPLGVGKLPSNSSFANT